MSSVALDICNSCFMLYNSTDHAPLILSCYHTYCRTCVDTFMFLNQQITCLSCSKVTQATSVSSLPQNPYLQPRDSISPLPPYLRKPSGSTVEDVYYSDSDEEKSNSGVSEELKRNLIINSQKNNINLISEILDTNMQSIQKSKSARKLKNETLNETLSAVERLKSKLENDIKNNKKEAKIIIDIEKKSITLSKQFTEVNGTDYNSIKFIYQEGSKIQKILKAEVDVSNVHMLERAICQSTVKINFDKADPFLTDLKAENDQIYMKLSTSLENDSELIFLSTFMLKSLFTDKIATHNKCYKNLSEIEYDQMPFRQFEDLGKFMNVTEAMSNPINSEVKVKMPISAKSSEWNVFSSKINNNVAGQATNTFPGKPVSFSDMAKKQATPAAAVVKRIPFPEKTIAQTNRPHCFFKMQVDNHPPFRVVFELRPDMAPKMVENFVKLCKGLPNGRGYNGSKIYRAKDDDHLLGGDFENNDGTGGHSAFEERYVLAEQCPLRDHKGAIRMRGQERTMDGRCKIGSQFMIWVGDLEYKEYRFTLVFGKVVEGFDQLQEISRIKAVQKSPTSWVLRQTVNVIDSGVL
eukprot:GFUD01021750.1.p1 GENE.GFUD01021750.1~~GFUD01021750.1.p1  ORF type:complete len:594 (-),score=132.57 GFUD01021750.1:493-2229(-)